MGNLAPNPLIREISQGTGCYIMSEKEYIKFLRQQATSLDNLANQLDAGKQPDPNEAWMIVFDLPEYKADVTVAEGQQELNHEHDMVIEGRKTA